MLRCHVRTQRGLPEMLRCTTHDVSWGWTVCKVSGFVSGEAEWGGTGGVFATSLYLRLPISPPGQSCDLATRTDSTTKKWGCLFWLRNHCVGHQL